MKFEDLLVFREWISLLSIADLGDNRLRAIICAGAHTVLPREEIIGKHVDEVAKMPLEYTLAPYYELVWEGYSSFMVRDECDAANRGDEEHLGHGVRLFKKSWLLASVPNFSNGAQDYRQGMNCPSMNHFGLYCVDHIVDVLAYDEPIVHDLGLRAWDSIKTINSLLTTPPAPAPAP